MENCSRLRHQPPTILLSGQEPGNFFKILFSVLTPPPPSPPPQKKRKEKKKDYNVQCSRYFFFLHKPYLNFAE